MFLHQLIKKRITPPMEEDSLSDSDFGRRDDEGEREGEEGIYADIFTVASPIFPRGSLHGLLADHGRHVAPAPALPAGGSTDTTVRDKAGIISPSSENHDD